MADASGAVWWAVAYRRSRFLARLRVRDGNLTPLEGPARRMPRRVVARTAFSMRSGPFRVGFRDLEAEIERSAGEPSFVARFREEPEWRMPFVARPFLRAALRYPFEAEGSLLRFAVLEHRAGPPTVLVRDFEFRVQESWLVKWLGWFVGSVVSEFRQEAEADADEFVAEALLALRADLLALAEGD